MTKRSIMLVAMIVAVSIPFSLALGQTNDRGIDPQNFDEQCSPCKDFDQYSNGTWKNNNPIPAEYTSWGTWNEVRERNLKIVQKILEETSKEEHSKGSVNQKVGDYYNVAMDTRQIEADGASPIAADLAKIDALETADDLRNLIAEYHAMNLNVVFDLGVEQDLEQSDQYIVYATQGGLGLPERDYYLKDDDESVKIRDQYLEHVANMLKLAGIGEADAASYAQTVMAIEARLANASLTRIVMRNPESYYNIVSVKDADALTPNFSWSLYLESLNLGDIETFSYAQPDFFAEINMMIGELPMSDWQTYLKWHIITDAAPRLSNAFVTEDFRFYRQVLSGAEEIQPRWKRVQRSMNRQMGEAVGQIYVAQAFPPQAKEKALKMIDDLRTALKSRIEGVEWMGAETKAKALAKLSTFTPKIGYPDKWRDYSDLNIETDSYLANVRRTRSFEFRRNLKKIGQPVDKTEWGIAPQIVNAYYNPLMNEIVFPAGILQPPFFDFEIDDAVNYGAMGAVIGHELLHGFDDQGRKFNADGNMKNWWTDEDNEKFNARAQRLIDQFDNYEVADGEAHVQGELTLGENIADLGGLTMAYHALQLAIGDDNRNRIDGLTPEQRFFVSWSQVWRNNVRNERVKLLVNIDSHAPARYRVNGPLSNMPEFFKAFGCETEDEMVNPLETRVTIW